MNYRIRLLCSTVLLAVSAHTPLHAQTSDMEEIVVTARKREESLQDVPVAITAISGAELEARGYAQARDLFASTPGLYFSQTGQRQNDEQFYLTIRGVGSAPVVEPSVGLFVDGIYITSLGWSSDFLDLERIEVLRGPQGALFGRNTEGGAVSIVTRKPDQTVRGRVMAEAAEFGSFKMSGATSGPLSDNVFAGVAAFASTTNGYMTNVTRKENQDNKDRFGGRVTLRALPSDSSEIILTGDYMKSDGRFDAYGDAVANQTVRVVDPQTPAGGIGTFLRSHTLAGRRYTTFGNDENTVRSENYGLGLSGTKDFGAFSMTSITGYRYVESRDSYDNDGIATANSTNAAFTQQEIVSEELRFSSNGDDALSWIAGVYGFSEKLDQDRLSRFVSGVTAGPIAGDPNPSGFTSDNVDIKRKGLAGFGQLAYQVTSDLEFAVGARYSHEKVDQQPNLRVRVQIPGSAPATGPRTVVDVTNNTRQKKSFNGFSPSGSLSYHLTSDLLVYGSVATGFKGGGFTKEIPNTPQQNAALDNEKSLNYELGLKGETPERVLSFNTALFYTKLKNQQLSTRIELAPGTNVYIPSTLNVGKGHAKGIEMEGVLRPVPEMRIVASASYTKSEFDDYVASPATSTAPAYNRAGQAFPEVPAWLASLSGEYDIALGGDMMLTPLLSWRFVDDKYIGQGNAALPFVTIESTSVFDGQLTFSSNAWSITAFVKNIGDKYYFVNRFQLQPATSAPGAQTYAKPAAPRQFGARFAYQF